MAVSGTVDTTVVKVGQVVDTALRRCRVLSSMITWEMLTTANHQLYILLSSLPNKGRMLWTIRETLVGFTEAVSQYSMPAGTIDLDKSFYRTVTPQDDGTPSSSAGGTAANAFDGSIDTACTQVSANGNISYQFQTSTTVTIVAVMPNGDKTWTLSFQSSTDGVTWTTVLAPGEQSYTDRVCTWYNISNPRPGTYFRVAVSGGGTLDVIELVFGSNPTDIEMARMNQDDFTSLPNRTFQGNPNQFWLDRPYNSAIVNVWPTPASGNVFTSLFVGWNRRYVMDVGALYDSLEVPRRWLDAVEWDLSYRMYHEIPDDAVKEWDPNYLAYLGNMSARYIGEAFDEERDKSPIKFGPRIGCYTK